MEGVQIEPRALDWTLVKIHGCTQPSCGKEICRDECKKVKGEIRPEEEQGADSVCREVPASSVLPEAGTRSVAPLTDTEMLTCHLSHPVRVLVTVVSVGV